MKLVRILLIIIVLFDSVYVWRRVYQFVYDLIDFQIGIYQAALEGSQQLGNIKDSVGDVIGQALGSFGGDLFAWTEESWVDSQELANKIDWFKQKLQIISALIGGLIWLFVAKILYGVLFGFTSFLNKLRSFIS